MALSNLFGWIQQEAPSTGSACGAGDKPAACGASSDKPAEAPAACGSADT